MRALRQDELPAGLAVPGHGLAGGPRPARRGLTHPRIAARRPAAGTRLPAPSDRAVGRGTKADFPDVPRTVHGFTNPEAPLGPPTNRQRRQTALRAPLTEGIEALDSFAPATKLNRRLLTFAEESYFLDRQGHWTSGIQSQPARAIATKSLLVSSGRIPLNFRLSSIIEQLSLAAASFSVR